LRSFPEENRRKEEGRQTRRGNHGNNVVQEFKNNNTQDGGKFMEQTTGEKGDKNVSGVKGRLEIAPLQMKKKGVR